jgi:hypothetical protein
VFVRRTFACFDKVKDDIRTQLRFPAKIGILLIMYGGNADSNYCYIGYGRILTR